MKNYFPVFLTTLTFFGHADFKALLQPTVLAAVAGHFVDLTVLVSVAGIHHVLLDTAPKETLKNDKRKCLVLYKMFSLRSQKTIIY